MFNNIVSAKLRIKIIPAKFCRNYYMLFSCVMVKSFSVGVLKFLVAVELVGVD